MNFLYDVKFVMWLLTMLGVALIKFNDLAHLSKTFKELKQDIRDVVEKIDKIIEKIEHNEIRITEIDTRCKEREKHIDQTLNMVCKASKTAKSRRTRRKKTQN